MMLEYETQLPTYNEYSDIERKNRYMAAAIKKRMTTIIKILTINQTRTKLSGLYDIEITWIRTNYRHDSDNVYFAVKFLLDGIVASKVLPGDSRKYIRNISNSIEQGTKEKVIVKFNLIK